MWELEKTEVKNQSWEGSLPWSTTRGKSRGLDSGKNGMWVVEEVRRAVQKISREDVNTELVRRKRGHWDPMGAEEEDTELGEMGITETLFERHDGRWSCWYMPFNTALRQQ